MLTYKIHLIRHGLTQGNLEGRYIGVTDMPLCEQGRRQLEELRESCDYPWVDRVFTSPMLRARQSAELLFPDRAVEVVDNLRELDFGDFEGRTIEDLEKDAAFRQWISAPSTACPPNGESGQALTARATDAIAGIFARMMREKISSVAVVTHGGLIMNLLAAMGLPERDMVRWNVQNGEGYTVLLSTQMWIRDHKFEVYGQIPLPKTPSTGDEEPSFFA